VIEQVIHDSLQGISFQKHPPDKLSVTILSRFTGFTIQEKRFQVKKFNL